MTPDPLPLPAGHPLDLAVAARVFGMTWRGGEGGGGWPLPLSTYRP